MYIYHDISVLNCALIDIQATVFHDYKHPKPVMTDTKQCGLNLYISLCKPRLYNCKYNIFGFWIVKGTSN